MNGNRLAQLKRQRDLLLEHLDWLSLEIERETASSAQSRSPKTSRLIEAIPPDRPVAENLGRHPESTTPTAADLYDQLGPDTKGAAADTKRGCLLMSAAAFLAVAGLIAYVFFWYK